MSAFGGLESIGSSLIPEEEEQEVFTKPVFCLACKAMTVPDGRWRCQACKSCCRFGIVRLACPSCSQPTWARREAYRIKAAACLCQNPERIAAMRRREAEDREEAKREFERAERARYSLRLATDANECLEAKGGFCRVSYSDMPHDHCVKCKKWGSRREEASFGGGM